MWFGQWTGTTLTGQWWGDSPAAPAVSGDGWRGPGGEFHQRVDDDPFLRILPPKVEKIIERVAREVEPVAAKPVLAARLKRAGVEWDESLHQILEEMHARDVETLQALRQAVAHERLLEDDDDAIAVIMLLH